MRLQLLTLVVGSFALCSVSGAQSQPQFLRDYVYGPNGQLVVTIEPDTYGPLPGNISGSWSHHACLSYSASVSWSAMTDIGSGTAGYKVYRNGIFKLSTTSLSYLDSSVSADTSYDYDVYGYDNAGNLGAPAEVEVDVGDCYGEELSIGGRPSIKRAVLALESNLVTGSDAGWPSTISPTPSIRRLIHENSSFSLASFRAPSSGTTWIFEPEPSPKATSSSIRRGRDSERSVGAPGGQR